MIKEETYVDNDIINLDKENNITLLNLCKDAVIKSLFARNKELLKRFIILQIKDIISLDANKTTITIGNVELGKTNHKERNNIIDTYVILNDNIHIDLEYNSKPYYASQRRNIFYLNKLSTKVLESGDNVNKLDNTYVSERLTRVKTRMLLISLLEISLFNNNLLLM